MLLTDISLTTAGGETLGVKKRKKHKKKPQEEGAEPAAEQGGGAAGEPEGALPTQVKSGQAYEAEFASEIERAKEGKAKSTPWGSGFAKAPEILHGKANQLYPTHQCPYDRRSAWICQPEGVFPGEREQGCRTAVI